MTSSSYIKSKMTRNGDAIKLDSIQLYLQKKKLVANREVNVPVDDKRYREIDMRVKFKKGYADLLLDSYQVHGCMDMDQNNETRRRNIDLTRAGLEWRIIDEELCSLLKIPKEVMAYYLSLEMNMHLLAQHDCQ